MHKWNYICTRSLKPGAGSRVPRGRIINERISAPIQSAKWLTSPRAPGYVRTARPTALVPFQILMLDHYGRSSLSRAVPFQILMLEHCGRSSLSCAAVYTPQL